MFDSLLNSKFYNKCKHAIKCIRTRLDPIRRKKQAMLRFLKKDIADLLTDGLDSYAKGRMEGLIIEMNLASCYDMIDQFCDHIVKQLNSLQKQRECPQEAMEAVATLIFAAARFPDLPELCDLRQIFTERYGNFIDSFVSHEFVWKLQNKSFSNEEKLQVMQNIAEEFSIGLDTKALERKLSCPPLTKHDMPKKGPYKRVESAPPVYHGQKADKDALHDKESKATNGGHKQKREMQLKPKDIHVMPDGIGRLHEKSRKQYSDKPDDMEHVDNNPPLDMKRRNGQKEAKKDVKNVAHPSRRELMDAEELDMNGLRKKDVGSVKYPEGEINKKVNPYTKAKEVEKEDGIEKDNGKGNHRHRSCMVGGPDHDWRRVDLGLKELGLNKQGIDSVNSSNGKTVNKPPPYTKTIRAASGKSPGEDNNGFSYDKPQHVGGEFGQSVQDRQQVTERAVNMRPPPYVKPKCNMRSLQEDLTNQTTNDYKHKGAEYTDCLRDGLVDDEALRPVSVRRKHAKPPPYVDSYDGAPNEEQMTDRTPSAQRRHSSKQDGAYDNYDRKNGYLQPHDGNGVDNAVNNGKHVQRTPSSRRRHTSRRNGGYDDYDGAIWDQEAEDDETDSAIDFGNLLPRSAGAHWKHKSRSTDTHSGGRDEEERMMDKLLIHYSKKGLDREEAKARSKTWASSAGKAVDDNGTRSHRGGSMHHPPERAVSLPTESISEAPDEKAKVHARSNSMQPEMLGPGGGHVHPRMPDCDELAARISALRNA